MLIHLIVGARAHLLKAAPVVEQLRLRHPACDARLIHTGCPDDRDAPERLLERLQLPEPDVYLGVAADGHLTHMTGIMLSLQRHFQSARPNVVIVFGDDGATLAGALSASQLGIPVAHVEAGLRSFDRTTPEEVNRVLTDALARWLFVTDRDAEVNLRSEGIQVHKIHFVGSTTIDTLAKYRPAAAQLHFAARLGIAGPYALVTLRRPENVDGEQQLRSIIYALLTLAEEMDVVFPVHPRTDARLREFGLRDELHGHEHLRVIGETCYLEFLSLLNDACAVLTDSGSVQEEALVAGVPCVTLLAYTERPVTLQHGGNRLAGNDPHLAIRYITEAARRGQEFAPIPEGWDGNASARIVDVLEREVLPKGPADRFYRQVLPEGSQGPAETSGPGSEAAVERLSQDGRAE